MINITDKYNCCGCSACVQACPKQCISFDEDDKGFRYPHVDTDTCIDCGLCEKVCPYINQNAEAKPQKVYASINPNEEVRLKSSSGGIFSALAEKIIADGGVVFGVTYDDNWEVIHTYVEKMEDIAPLRGSKYVQSRIGNSFIEVRDFLKSGRKVLFSGTSCQIAALKKFLRKEYDNLLTIDIICHGVPSPLVWRDYVSRVKANPVSVAAPGTVLPQSVAREITNISFRDKKDGWKNFALVFNGKDGEILRESAIKNLFMKVFLNDLCLRPSCHNCPAKAGKCGSDISIADYWLVWTTHPEMDDNKGTSIIFANTNKGQEILSAIELTSKETTFEEACLGNPCILNSTHENEFVPKFWEAFGKSGIAGAPEVLNTIPPKPIPKELLKYLPKN